MVKKFGLLVMLLLPAALLGQSAPSAVGGEGSIWVGAQFTTFNPDYGCDTISPFHCTTQLRGPTVFGDVNFRRKWGLEGEARWLHWNSYGGEKESNYLIGPRYRAFRYHKLDGWTKVLVGGGWITTPGYPNAGTLQGSYFDVAVGGDLQYPLTRRLSARGGYEFQFWPSFAGPPNYDPQGNLVQHNSGLTPNGFSIGFMYRLLGH